GGSQARTDHRGCAGRRERLCHQALHRRHPGRQAGQGVRTVGGGGVTGDDRQLITERLHAALWALEQDDTEGWRSNVDALIEWRTQPFVQGLTRLARELEQALGEDAGDGNSASLPDACARLEHVVVLTEKASMRSLDLVDECG